MGFLRDLTLRKSLKTPKYSNRLYTIYYIYTHTYMYVYTYMCMCHRTSIYYIYYTAFKICLQIICDNRKFLSQCYLEKVSNKIIYVGGWFLLCKCMHRHKDKNKYTIIFSFYISKFSIFSEISYNWDNNFYFL